MHVSTHTTTSIAQDTAVRIVVRKGQMIGEYRSTVARRGWLRMPLDEAEQLLRDRALAGAGNVELQKRQARMGFAPDMVRLPYLVRMVTSCGRVLYCINHLREGLAPGHTYPPVHGGTAVVVQAL